MAYLVKKRIGRKSYFYLVTSVKIRGKVKKFQVYVGTRRPSAAQRVSRSAELKKRILEFTRKVDPLAAVLSKSDIAAAEKAKKWYRWLSAQSPTVRQNYYEWFVTTYTYDSNAIEGSTLTLRETGLVLFEGISPPGRPLRDIRAAENHKRAFDWLLAYKGDVSKQLVLKLHKILTAGILPSEESGRLRRVQVYIRGAKEVPPRPAEVEPQLVGLLKWYKANKKRYHPVVLAAHFHAVFEKIHPFVDFNGRTGRLLLNFILMKAGYPPLDIRNKDRQRYYAAIRTAIGGELRPFVRLIIKYPRETAERR